MKNYQITLLTILALTAPVFRAQSSSEADITAIKEVIIDETEGHFNRN